MSVTRVDPETLDGMTFDDWLHSLAAMYRYTLDTATGTLVEDTTELDLSGFTFDINTNGELVVTASEDAVEGISFALVDGKLVVTYVD